MKNKTDVLNGNETQDEIKISNGKKIPKDVSQDILKQVLKNLLIAIVVMLYFVVLNIAYVRMKQERLMEDMKIFAVTFLVIGIAIIEMAYKKDSGRLAINGIELLVLSLHTLSIMHMIVLLKYDFRIYVLVSSYIFSIYYVLKSILIYTKGRKEYLNSLSDISEIVKKDEPIRKEAKRRNKKEK